MTAAMAISGMRQICNAVAYTGNAASQNVITRVKNDLVWLKRRNGVGNNYLYDTVRGANKSILSNTAGDQSTGSGELTVFASNGFTLGNASAVNGSTNEYISFAWRELPNFFDIVPYTGNGANRTINHNLGVTPQLIIVKQITALGSDFDWAVYHSALGNTKYLTLNTSEAAQTGATWWNNASPTSSVFSVGTESRVNSNGDSFIAYLFAELTGRSKFGSYSLTGSPQSISCGFRPKVILVKRTTAATSQSWFLFYEVSGVGKYINPDLDGAENSATGNITFTNTGFDLPAGAGDFIYAAWG